MFDPNDGPLLMRAILEDPDNDQPRRCYADWLMDRAWDGDAERAEFILIQCEIAEIQKHHNGPCAARRVTQDGIRLLWRERELFEKFKCGWFGGDSWAIYYLGHESEDSEQYPALTSAFISRGFVGEVRTTCEAFMRPESDCDECNGHGLLSGPKGSGACAQGTVMEECKHCSSTGRIPGMAETLFQFQPVTKVVLTDAMPRRPHLGSPMCWWVDDPDDHRTQSERLANGVIPKDALDLLEADKRAWRTHNARVSLVYESLESANNALSRDFVNLGRQKVGLPPYPAPPTPKNPRS